MDLHIQMEERRYSREREREREREWGLQIGQEKVEKGKGYWKQTYRYW